ncbi:MAG: BREX-6 system BrxE protein [Tildeniella nuda ZEHNDER 1965/U140]|jgi:hypothetical protein|nr:BREX-6 system BrxE protein [Tildeniella nuda ZEHNDER 1965/U140]
MTEIFQQGSPQAIEKPNEPTLDAILALQMTIAWAGEGLCEPKRLNWWRTDLIDQSGGGYLLQNLLPKTHEWASLEAVRQAAIQQDKQTRQNLAQPDHIRTLFFWGFIIDEQLADRLGQHKRSGQSPDQSLPLPLELGSDFTTANLEAAIRIPNQVIDFKVAPSGRELMGKMPDSLELCVRNLVAALLPLAERYPMPFYRLRNF